MAGVDRVLAVEPLISRREMRRLVALPVPPNDLAAQLIHNELARTLARYGPPPSVA